MKQNNLNKLRVTMKQNNLNKKNNKKTPQKTNNVTSIFFYKKAAVFGFQDILFQYIVTFI